MESGKREGFEARSDPHAYVAVDAPARRNPGAFNPGFQPAGASMVIGPPARVWALTASFFAGLHPGYRNPGGWGFGFPLRFLMANFAWILGVLTENATAYPFHPLSIGQLRPAIPGAGFGWVAGVRR